MASATIRSAITWRAVLSLRSRPALALNISLTTAIAGRFVMTTVTRERLADGWKLLAPCGVPKLPCLHGDVGHVGVVAGDKDDVGVGGADRGQAAARLASS